MDPKLLFLFFLTLPILCSFGQATVPAATPVTVNPTPASTPVTVTPGTNNPGGGGGGGGGQPVSNPVTSPGSTPVTTPAVAPPGGNAASGGKWCVVKSGAAQAKVQAALDYACGMGKADCSAIQQGGSCYNPNTLQNHASYAFNSYFQKNPTQTSCQFEGVAVISTTNPSTGSCVFPTSSSSSSTTGSPTPNGTPTASTGAVTPSGTGTSGSQGSPGLGGIFPTGIGESPANTTTDSYASAGALHPLLASIIVGAAAIVTL